MDATFDSTDYIQSEEPGRDDRRLSERRRPRRGLTLRDFGAGMAAAAIAVGGTWLVVDLTTAKGTHAPAAAQEPAADPSGSHPTSGSGSSATTSHQQGAWVATLQRDLAQLNYYDGSIDGVYGPGTTAAIENLQRAYGLPVDGTAGPQTMAKINQLLVTGDNQMAPTKNVAPANPPSGGAPIAPGKGGSTDGGSTNGGTTNGGSTNGGTTNGGTTNGGTTNGGTTNGGTTNGGHSNTAGGSTTSGADTNGGGAGTTGSKTA